MRRAALLALLCLTPALLAVPAAVPRDNGGHFDELGVWVPDEVPDVTYLPGADLGAYRNHSEMAAYLAALEGFYPGQVDRFSIGQSVRGLDLWAVRITEENLTGPKPKVLIDAAHHGDEIIGVEIALRLAADLLSGRFNDATIARLVDDYETWIVPMANPDGVTNIPTATHYAMARKNANSVDTNRNYAYHWGGPGSGGPGSDTYRGPSEFSEPETRAIRDLLQAHDFLMYVSIHSGAELILWPWGWTTAPHHERGAYDELGDQLTQLSGGVPNGQTSLILYTASGVSMDYGAGGPDKLRPFSFSPETYQGSGNAFDWYHLFNPPDANIEPVYQGWKPALLRMIEAAPEYTAASLESPDLDVTGESFFPSGHLEAPGKRGFRNATAVLNVPPQLEVFSSPAVGLGDVLQGQTRDPGWVVQANASGTFSMVVRALSPDAAGNLTRIVAVTAHDVVKYLQVGRPVMGAKEENAVNVWLGGFGLTGITGRLRIVADGETIVDEDVAIPDGGEVRRAIRFNSGDRPAGRSILVLTYDLQGQGPSGPVTRHVEQRASYTIVRPDVAVSFSVPATGKVGTAFTGRTTLRNVGNLPTQNLTVFVDLPQGYAANNGRVPSANDPLGMLSRPAPSLVAAHEGGGLRLVYQNLTLVPGQAQTLELRLTPLLPGTHVLRVAADYTMTQTYDPAHPAPTRLHDEGAASQTVS